MFEAQAHRTKASGFAQGANRAQAASIALVSAGFASGHTLIQAKRAVRLSRPAHNQLTCTFMLGSAASQAQQPVMQERSLATPSASNCKGFQVGASSPFQASAISLTVRSSGRKTAARFYTLRASRSGAAYLGR
jgi:hypothetical protein